MHIFKAKNKIQYTKNHGAFSFVCRDKHLLNEVQKKYQRTNIVLKIFFRPLANAVKHDNLQMLLSNYIYGHHFTDDDNKDRASKLVNSVKVQNICAFEGLAPRVYGIDLLEYDGLLFPMVIVEDLGDELGWDVREVTKLWDKLVEVGKKYGFDLGYFDGNPTNMMQGKWIDFQGFTHVDNYVDNLHDRLVNSATWSGNHYQSVPQLNIDGFRKTHIRNKELGLDRVDFKGKRVLDVGCSGGQFCMYASDHEAQYIVGVDLPEVVEGTRELVNHLGYFNIDLHGMNVTKEQLDYQADITLYLSMYMHVGMLEWVVNATREMMIFETNGISEQGAKDILSKYFSRVETVGYASDFDGRSIIHCYK